MLKDTKSELTWLAKLQNDLHEDRKNEMTQADPVYYGIQDIASYVTEDGYHDYITYYDSDACEEMSFAQLFTDGPLADEKTRKMLLTEEIIRSKDWNYEIVDEDEFNNFLEDHGISICFIAETPIIKTDVLFLTRKDAQAHLDDNRHHYTNKAVTYAMTAWRSPRYEHLMELLRNIDFERSNIVFKTPEHETLTHIQMHAYAIENIDKAIDKGELPTERRNESIVKLTALLDTRCRFTDMSGHEDVTDENRFLFDKNHADTLISTWLYDEMHRITRKGDE